MYLLINIYESEDTSAYVNEVKQFNTEEDAETQMKKDVEQAFSDYHETWSAENEDEEHEPYVDEDDTSMFICGYDYKDMWQIYKL